MTAIQNCIEFYLQKGYALTPLKGKIPTIRKWQNAEYDPIFSCSDNFGVVLQDDDLVVDIDPRNGGKIPDFLNGIKTLTIKTGGGGWHYYFKKDPKVQVVGLLKEYPGVEYKTKGQQVVGAGSRTTSDYEIINNVPVMKCPFLPLITRKANILKTNRKIDYQDDSQTQERFVKYLSNCPVATQGENGDKTTFAVACHGRDLGLSEQKTLELMVIYYNPRCIPSWAGEELNIKVNNAYKYASNDAGSLNPKADFTELEKQSTGIMEWEMQKDKIKPSFRNTLNVLLLPNTEISGMFKFNEFSENIEFTRQSPWHKSEKDINKWTDVDAVMLKEWISNNHRFAPDVSFIHEAVLAVSKRISYHPVKNYLHGIKWDGKERICSWLIDYLGVEDSLYAREIGKIVLCAAVSRIFRPGIKFDYLMVLEGPQGQGKSRICKALGGDFHIGLRLDPHNKDFIDYMHSKWIVEIEEMDFATKAESQAVKAFLSRDTDRCRLAYARVTKDFPRQCIFIGTYNPLDGESTYLKDPTGNRRFWPIGITNPEIDVVRLSQDRDQLWAEAVCKAKECQLYLSKEAEQLQHLEQHNRKERDVWHDLILAWAMNNVKPNKSVTGLTIYTQCIGGRHENYHQGEGRRIANTLRLMGWEKVSVWDSVRGYPTTGYKRPAEEADTNVF